MESQPRQLLQIHRFTSFIMTLGRKPCQQHPDTSPPPMESPQCCCSCQR
jgi:hypothetical protein